jgi:hypothetical protein
MSASQTGYTLTIIADSFDDWGKTRTVLAKVAPGSSTYYTTGYLIAAATVGLRLITDAVVSGLAPTSGTHLTTLAIAIFDVTATALQYFIQTGTAAALAEVGSGVDVSGYPVLVRFFGN